MKKIQGLVLAATLMLTANSLMAQTYSELGGLFSRTRPGGTARIMGMGGAQISLGGDMSSAWSNPAGLGMFNRSEFSISPQFFSFQNKNGSYYSGSTVLSDGNNDTRTGINIPAMGLVLSRPQDGESFIQGTFAITMTKLNDFNSNLQYTSGVPNPNTSLIDYFLNDATGFEPSELGGVTGLAYDNFLIGDEAEFGNPDPTVYFTDVAGTPMQNETIKTKGGQNQWNLSYGANFNDKFFLGAGLGIVALNYQSEKSYSESFNDDGPLNDFTLLEDLRVRGTGINLTVGGIVRPVGGLQLGASITTPTRYNLTDNYTASLRSSWKGFDYYGDGSRILGNESSETDIITSSYTLMTPWRLAFGASYIFGKVGLLSLDIERMNYGAAKLNSQTSGLSFDTDNSEIEKAYTSRTNVRLGGEVRVKDFRFRGGFGVMPDAAASSRADNVSNTWSTASLGVGYRKSNFYVDFAYTKLFANGNIRNNDGFQYNSGDENKGNIYVPYTVANGPALMFDQVSSNFIATLGFTF